ncbi:MAG: hypothetical protein ABIR80_17570 [Opitutaceae bacterium]
MKTAMPLIIGLLALSQNVSCTAEKSDSKPIRTTWRELADNPKEFAGKRVSLVGVFVLGFETALVVSPINPDKTDFKECIWFDYAKFPVSEKNERGFDKLFEALEEASQGLNFSESKQVIVHAEGKFLYTPATKKHPLPGFGHLGAFSSSLELERVHSAKPFRKTLKSPR